MDYKNGKVYRIDCLVTGETYIGSTCQPTLAKRMAKHVDGFKKWKKTGKGFVTSYPIIERANYNITLLEAIQCNTKDELNAREGYYIRTTDCVNKRISGRTKHDYYKDKKEQILEQRKEYYEANKAEIAERQKDYREANSERLLEQKRDNYKVNKEAFKIKRDANKERISARRKVLREQKKLEKLQKKADLS